MTTEELPDKLADVVDDFAAVTERERLQLLLEFSEGLPELPARYAFLLLGMKRMACMSLEE